MSSPGPDDWRPRHAGRGAEHEFLGQGAADGGGQRQQRRSGGARSPGAHRASKPDRLIPGFRRSRNRPRPATDPYPADLPLNAEAGLTADGYGITAEGDLAEAEYAAARLPRGRPSGDWPDGLPPGDVPRVQPTGGDDVGGPRPGAAGPSLVRSSGVMALGTLASRVTGLIRSIVVLYALGAIWLGNAYNYANSLPNTVYNLAIGGILTSVIVPLLVTAAKRDTDSGERYTQRMFTLVTVVLAAITAAATLAAGPIAALYGCSAKTCSAARPVSADYHHLLVIFAFFFIPQIFFYGISSLAGAILNARGHFASPMWTPVVNNVVVIAVTIAFMVIAGFHQTVQTITPLEVGLLGVGTTLGIVAQTVALVPYLHRVGFRWRPRFDFRRADVAEIGRMAGWMFGYVLTTQVAYLVTSRVAATVNHPIDGVGKGFTSYSNAWLLFQLPYAIVGISVITALLPRMSEHASDERYDLLRSDFSAGVRLGSVIVAPAALVLAMIGPPLAEVLLGWGNTTVPDARYLGLVFSVFSLGLTPYMLFQLLLRVFYSLHDSRTPALIGVVTMVANIAANLLALIVASPGNRIAALGVGFGLANSIGCILAWRVLSRRIGGLAGRQIGRSLLRMHAAALPAALFALGIALVITAEYSTGKVYAAAIVVIGGSGALLLYVLFARVLGVPEVTDLFRMVRSRLGR